MLNTLVGFRMDDEGVNPIWHLQAELDLRDIILDRPKQRAYLARYGRQDFFQDRTILELEAAVKAVAEIVSHENELNRVQEDK